MKMSDVFALPVRRVGDTLADQGGYADGAGEANAAAHAINQHDALVEALIDIILCAPSHGPLWHGSDEIKRAKEILSRE